MSVLRIAEVAPALERVPPAAYGGTERVIFELVNELDRRGHEVTTFASADSSVPGRLVPTVPRALRPAGIDEDPLPWSVATATLVLEAARRGEFDLVHSHLEVVSDLLAAASPVPVVATYHGRIDHPGLGIALAGSPAHHVAISAHQASTRPDVPWAAIIHNGLTLRGAPAAPMRDDSLVFVGRVAAEKGILDAMEVAHRVGRRLRIAAKVGGSPAEVAFHHDVFLPALERAGDEVEFLGEMDQGDRDALLASSYACLMPGAWPEPFGLVAIEALACGTPVLARRVGATPEIVREGVDGFFGDDVRHLASLVDRVQELDREAIRASVVQRFSAERMTDEYEALFTSLTRTAGGRRRRAASRSHAPATRTRRRSNGAHPSGQPPSLLVVEGGRRPPATTT